MKLILATLALATLVQRISAADLDGIQNATPISIPLNNPSLEFDGVNNGDAAQEEDNLSGYRPLYPPYFNLNRNSNEQQKEYYDKEYYSRGAQSGKFDSRLDRTIKTPASGLAAGVAAGYAPGVGPALAPGKPADDVQVYVVNLNSQSQPESVVQLQNQPQSQLPVSPQLQLPTQVQTQSQIPLQSQQYARHFSSFRTQQTHSYFYNFKFPSS